MVTPTLPHRPGSDRCFRDAWCWPITAQAQAEARTIEHLLAVTACQKGGIDFRGFSINDLIDEDLIGHVVIRIRNDLPPADELRHMARHRFEDIPVTFGQQAGGRCVEFQCLHGGLCHERAGHTGIVVEMTLIEPGIDGYMRAGFQISPAPRPAMGVKGFDIIEESQPVVRQTDRT